MRRHFYKSIIILSLTIVIFGCVEQNTTDNFTNQELGNIPTSLADSLKKKGSKIQTTEIDSTIDDTLIGEQVTTKLNLSFESLEVPYNFESVKVFQISSFKNLTKPISKNLYMQLFQDLAIDRQTGDSEHTIPAMIHSKEFLLTKHQIDKRYDFLTVLKEYENGKRIFWLSYHAKDSVFSFLDDSLRWTKGELTNHGILSTEIKNDSIQIRSYSTFIEPDKIVTTTIVHHFKESKIDSTIKYTELLFHPHNEGFMGKAVGDEDYENGILMYEMWDDDAEWTKRKNNGD